LWTCGRINEKQCELPQTQHPTSAKTMDCELELLTTSHISIESQALSMAIPHRITNKKISKL
jgi:hypothetical protein